MLIDTHCHLDAAEFGGNQTALVQSAHSAGVQRIVVPSVERANFAAVHCICSKLPGCLPAYGIHPMYTNAAMPEDIGTLREYLKDRQPVAVGEIGLDFYIEKYDQEKQEYYFTEQLKLAREFDLPVLLHIRRAQDTVLKHLRRTKVRGGIAHAFNGSAHQAEEFIRLGFKLGFGGAATYTRATRLHSLIRNLPLASIVLETDAPDMPPAFLERHQPNKPEYLPRIAEILAGLRGISPEALARSTSENALAVLDKRPSES